MSDENYANIREILGDLIGNKVIEITQHDEDEFPDIGSYVMLMFENGLYVRFPVGDDGFDHNCDDAAPPSPESSVDAGAVPGEDAAKQVVLSADHIAMRDACFSDMLRVIKHAHEDTPADVDGKTAIAILYDAINQQGSSGFGLDGIETQERSQHGIPACEVIEPFREWPNLLSELRESCDPPSPAPTGEESARDELCGDLVDIVCSSFRVDDPPSIPWIYAKNEIKARLADYAAHQNSSIVAERDRLLEENENFKTWGIVEIMVRNPNVASHVREWEKRAETAEAKVAELEGELAAFVEHHEIQSGLDRERIAGLTAALRENEWTFVSSDGQLKHWFCPTCNASKEKGHRRTCWVGNALFGSDSALDDHTEEAVRPWREALQRLIDFARECVTRTTVVSHWDRMVLSTEVERAAALLTGTAQPENKEGK